MKLPHRCDDCGDDCRTAFRIVAHVQTSSNEHEERVDFCSVECLTDWAQEYGYSGASDE